MINYLAGHLGARTIARDEQRAVLGPSADAVLVVLYFSTPTTRIGRAHVDGDGVLEQVGRRLRKRSRRSRASTTSRSGTPASGATRSARRCCGGSCARRRFLGPSSAAAYWHMKFSDNVPSDECAMSAAVRQRMRSRDHASTPNRSAMQQRRNRESIQERGCLLLRARTIEGVTISPRTTKPEPARCVRSAAYTHCFNQPSRAGWKMGKT
jgi:hypothetical protein